MAYATVEQVEAGFRPLTTEEKAVCNQLLDEAAIQLDAIAPRATAEAKGVVSCRMVRRAIAASSAGDFPVGATQGMMSAGGYSQSWTMSSGSTGELYVGKAERQILGLGNQIGASNPYAEVSPE